MGGSAFAHLSTPRMPPENYNKVLDSTHTILKQHYELVGSPIEAPGKETYGDIDILLFSPLPSSPLATIPSHDLAKELSQLLSAVHHISVGPTKNFAIPWPSTLSSTSEEEKYVQLDIKICSSSKMYHWELFHAAHGDLWNILGSTIRRFGLTVNNVGLYLRIPEIEALDRKKSMVLLTDDDGAILEFLGLDKQKWWTGFESREEMFEYAAGCRMFWIRGEKEEDEGMEGGEEGKKKLKHNDRQRMAKRPIFKEWMDEFIPKCRAEKRFAESGITREQIRDEAFVAFGEGVKTEYERRLKEWNLTRHTDEIWRETIKGNVPEDVDPQIRSASIKVLKGIIIDGERFKGKTVLEVVPNEEGYWDIEKVRTFVKENWKEAGDIGMARQQEKSIAGMKAKAEKKRLEAEEIVRKETTNT